MPENTGQAEPKPESKPEPKPSTPPKSKQPRGKYVNYQDLSKDELVAMLKRVNRRLSEANKLINEALNVLYYGNTQESGGQGQRYQRQGRGYGYRKYGYSGRNYNRQYKRRSEDEDEDVDYD